MKYLRPLTVLLLLSVSFSLQALTPGKDLTTVTVQFEVSLDFIKSEKAYRDAIEDAMKDAMAGGAADLVIFPEYLGVFASLIPYSSYLSETKPFQQVWADIAADYPGFSTLTDLFISRSEETGSFLDEIWSDLARKYNVFILSGSRFYYDPREKGLFNQAVVFDPDGKIVYKQNKFFLTEFEEELLGLSPGDLSDISGFSVKDHLVRLTICRDTFLKKWEDLYREGFLWIDIKANGVPYTPDQEDLFTRALPARLVRTPIPYGITACLTGEFLDLLWQGQSSIIYNNQSDPVRYLQRSRETDRFESLRSTFPGKK